MQNSTLGNWQASGSLLFDALCHEIGSWEGSVVSAAVLCVRQLSGRELLRATQEEVAALADAHGSAVRGIEQLLRPLVGYPCFRLSSFLDQDTTLKLPLELQVTVCGYVAPSGHDRAQLSYAIKAMTPPRLKLCFGAL